jgi:FkbH-like protein
MLIHDAIAIAATFTTEPLSASLQYWLDQLKIPAKIEFAPYNQVVQALLDTGGMFASNKRGLNVVLLRFEDWERFRKGTGRLSSSAVSARAKVQNCELIAALKTATSTADSTMLVCVCPPSPPALADPERKALLGQLEQDLESALAGLPIRFLSSARLLELYPVTEYYDAASDKLGHIPYTQEAYAAFGTAIARVFHASKRTPYKAIVLDCDNTLWRGICGEQGPYGIELDAPSRAVQNFVKARQKEGMLLCICSKNAAEDVEQTFDEHPEMPLARSDFIGWRVNWRPKPENIQSLATELSLGLDSFIFLDDNPMETAEVESRCRGVLALTLPAKIDDIPRFLDHVWAFDQTGLTAEDRNRTAMYRENSSRSLLLAESPSYADFLAGLELEVEIRELNGAGEIARAAQMTQRTNQFNFTTRRFTESEVREALSGGSVEILTTFVRDRFGNYGQVGLVMYEAVDDALRVQNLLLSCRVLGKGVEHAMVARLGQIAMARSLSAVEIAFQPTPKNTPARDFLSSLGACVQGFIYRFPAEVAASVRFSVPQNEPSAAAPDVEPDAVPKPPASGFAADFAWIATHRSDAASILKAVEDSHAIGVAASSAIQPRDEMERLLTRIWERVLRVSPIGIRDDFFDLGGDSFLAVRILANLEAITKRDLPLVTLFEAPTIAKLAEVLRNPSWKPHWNCLVPIKSSGGRAPFFCVHGVGGNVLEYMDLARHVHADQPLYGLQAIGLNGTVSREKFTIEEMAGRYISEIREFQPEGPYYLGGSSFGGLVAYEMARQLAAASQTVALVAMFDIAVPGSEGALGARSAWRQRMDTFCYRVTLHWRNILVLDPGERIGYIREKAKRLAGRVESRTHLPEAICSVMEAGYWAASRYVPGEYSGGITLFRATEQPAWVTSDRMLGWGNLVKGRIEIYDTPGHHADLVRDPRARVLARQLDDALAKAQARASAPAPR